MRFYMRGETIEQIAQALRIPSGTVKSRLNTGRKQIREGVEKMKTCTKQSYAPELLHLSCSGAGRTEQGAVFAGRKHGYAHAERTAARLRKAGHCGRAGERARNAGGVHRADFGTTARRRADEAHRRRQGPHGLHLLFRKGPNGNLPSPARAGIGAFRAVLAQNGRGARRPADKAVLRPPKRARESEARAAFLHQAPDECEKRRPQRDHRRDALLRISVPQKRRPLDRDGPTVRVRRCLRKGAGVSEIRRQRRGGHRA